MVCLCVKVCVCLCVCVFGKCAEVHFYLYTAHINCHIVFVNIIALLVLIMLDDPLCDITQF